jgi:hypothetical protein
LRGFHGAIVKEPEEIGEVKEPKEVEEVGDGRRWANWRVMVASRSGSEFKQNLRSVAKGRGHPGVVS